MPYKPLKMCSVNGCPNLCEGTYCEYHRKLMNKNYSRYQRDGFDRDFYKSKEWRTLREKFLTEHPLCAECLKNGLYTPATIVDHIKPIKMGGEALNPDNLQSLCWSCHTAKSNREGSAGFGCFKR